jgi:hypothetical protein
LGLWDRIQTRVWGRREVAVTGATGRLRERTGANCREAAAGSPTDAGAARWARRRGMGCIGRLRALWVLPWSELRVAFRQEDRIVRWPSWSGEYGQRGCRRGVG